MENNARRLGEKMMFRVSFFIDAPLTYSFEMFLFKYENGAYEVKLSFTVNCKLRGMKEIEFNYVFMCDWQ